MSGRRRSAPDGFEEFVGSRGLSLQRTAMLLTHQQAAAEDLVQTALVKAWKHWDSIDQPEAYVRRIIVHQFASDKRRRSSGEVPTDRMPEAAVSTDHARRVADRHDLVRALASLPPRQRAVIVLRYFHDYTERQTAEALGISTGTVKSQTSRALATLRVSDALPSGSDRSTS